MKTSQTAAILKHLESGRGITPADALKRFGCFRLAARISDLRKSGYAIGSKLIRRDGKQYARYSML